jgi:H(+)-translocating pyrophosphatase
LINEHVSYILIAFFVSISFMIGAFCSALSGYSGMWVSVRANVRVAAASRKCYNEAMQICFRGGAFAAIVNVALALFGISSMYLFLYFCFYIHMPSGVEIPIEEIPALLVGYGFGASFVAMFAQLGGGIYTKAADVGADLIGKVEAGIPEDDPRNPAVIADLVGDNVGDCAGQCADLFESISAEIISAMILGGTLAEQASLGESMKAGFILFPLCVHSLDLAVSTISVFFVKTAKGIPERSRMKEMEDPILIMKRAYYISIFLAAIGLFFICRGLLYINNLPSAYLCFYFCSLIGIAVSFMILICTQYYTDYNYRPVQRIAESSRMGHATNIITGLSVGLESTGFPIVIICIAILISFYLGEYTGLTDIDGIPIGGLYGTAIATMGMFSTGVFVLSMSGFGPIADNAGGIVEMSGQEDYIRDITDRLDAVGNVTKANTKGYSVGSATLACFLLFSAFLDEVTMLTGKPLKHIDITVPEIFIGGLLGSVTVFVFSAWAIAAVGNAAEDVIVEVRRQFREHPGILTYKEKPDNKR